MNTAYCKLYVVRNASSEDPFICIDCCMNIFHYFRYQFLFSYTLGHEVLFYDTLIDAQEDRHHSGTSEIYELVLDSNKRICKIKKKHYTVVQRLQEIINHNGKMYYDTRKPTSIITEWFSKEIDQRTYTIEYLNELNRQFQIYQKKKIDE
jgi:hypothetical protein